MKARKPTTALAVIVAAFAASLGAQAAIVNPDNDSAVFFAPRAATAPARITPALPQVGEVSPDGLYVYSASDRGWMHRSHNFIMSAGGLAHAPDCVPYDAPKPVAAIAPISQQGAFADHGV